ncbi:hypothetical protein K2173_000136 [Erythroxylum novogranatense]|uniref:Uncharacterized protein n=1 Tax=Erythroxylum novogranatense TaxID=1862640 RepID=A0AAV8SNM5_9ROSI|nr:hypothetical protein K2173_000136 [Erythroxylum novogranatense]
MVTKEKDDELALFLELRRRDKEKDKNRLLFLHDSDALDAPPVNNSGGSPISRMVSSVPHRKTAAERFLDSENEKSDYDWLITPPGTPLFPSLEKEPLANQLGMTNVRPTALKTRLTNIQELPSSRTTVASKQMNVSSGLNPSGASTRRSSTPTTTSRPATPTVQPTLPATAKHSRPSTPTSRSTVPSAKVVAPPMRSSTPTRAIARSSTPTNRPSVLPSKSTSRSATPTRLPSTTSSAYGVAAPPVRSSSVTKSAPSISKNPVPSRGSSSTVKSRPWKPNEMPGFSLDAPPNLRTSLPDRPASTTRTRPASATRSRPASASRDRPGVAGAQSSSSIEVGSMARNRQQSTSPARARLSSSSLNGGRISPTVKSRTKTNISDEVNPVRMGSKMVERVVNMRKLAPPKQDAQHSAHKIHAERSSLLDSSGFGRNISKKSIDMALRHMDIRRTVGGNLRPILTHVPASSMYSVRSGDSTKSRTLSVSDSPLATCSNASSEPSVNNNFFSDVTDFGYSEFGSERGFSSPGSLHRGT